MWDAIWEAGEPHGLTPLGLDALDILRIESGLIFAGYEFDDQVDPFEAGIGFAVDLKTDDDFVGRAALEERHAHPQRTLVGLELEGNETAGHGDEVYVGRQRVGVVTSGTRSPILKKNIALARVAVQVRGPRHGARGRQARRPAEAHRRDRRALPVLRPGQDPPPLLASMRRVVLCLPVGAAARRPRAAGDCDARRRARLRVGRLSVRESSAGREGGMAALELAAAHPDLVDRLVLVSTPVPDTDSSRLP